MEQMRSIGIAVRNTLRSDLPSKIKFPFPCDYDQAGYISICHWIDCWNIKGKILSLLNVGLLGKQQYYLMSKQNILDIIDELNDLYHHPKVWGNSIWTYDEIKDSLKLDIKNLITLYRFLKFHSKDNIQVYFYDND